MQDKTVHLQRLIQEKQNEIFDLKREASEIAKSQAICGIRLKAAEVALTEWVKEINGQRNEDFERLKWVYTPPAEYQEEIKAQEKKNDEFVIEPQAATSTGNEIISNEQIARLQKMSTLLNEVIRMQKELFHISENITTMRMPGDTPEPQAEPASSHKVELFREAADNAKANLERMEREMPGPCWSFSYADLQIARDRYAKATQAYNDALDKALTP